MFSLKCENAIKRALKLMEEECPLYDTGEEFVTSEGTKNFWKLRLGNRKNERFDMVFLNGQNRKIACETLFEGTIDSATIYPRIIIQKILQYNASAVILGHNHPSGMLEASVADKAITKRIMEACETIDVKVLDHIIVGNGVLSFAEKGYMSNLV